MSVHDMRGCVLSCLSWNGWFRSIIAVALLAGVACLPAGAATRTWTGGAVSCYWSGADNWGGVAPTDGDDLVFPAGAARLVSTNNLSSRKFRSVTFTGAGGGFQLCPYNSGTLLVTNGISAQNSAGTNTIYADVRLEADQSVTVTSAGGTLTVDGDINLNGKDLTANCTGSLNLSGAVTGAGDVTKTGAGTLELSGATTNSFSGTLRVNAGTLALNKLGSDTAVPGPLFIGDGSGTDTVRLLRMNQIPSTSTVVVASSGVLDVNSVSETLGGLTMTGGVVQTGSAILGVYGSVTASSSSSGPALISGKLTPGGGARTFTVGDGPASPDLRVTAVISGSGGGLTKEGAGELELTGTNTFTGTVTVNAGSLEVSTDEALGTTAGGTVVNNDARLVVWKGAAVGAEPLTLNGDGSGTIGALYASNGSNSWAGAITLGTTTLITVRTNDTLNIAGAISGSGKGFAKNGPGTLILSGASANTHTGTNTVSEGTLVLDKSASDGALVSPLVVGDGSRTVTVRYNRSNQLGASADVRVLAGGVLDLNGWSDSAGALSLEAGLVQTGAGAFTLAGDLTATSAASVQARVTGNLTLSGTRVWTVNDGPYSPDLYVSAALGGTGGFTKQGLGELQLAGAGTFGGTATVDAGHLRVTDGAALGATSGGTVVSAGAALALTSGTAVGAEPLTLHGNGTGSYGALVSLSGSNSWAGAITLADDTVLEVRTNTYLNLAGSLAGTRGFNKTGPGTLILSGSGNNSHSGSNTVSLGTLALAKTGTARAFTAGKLVIGRGSDADDPPKDCVVLYAGSSASQIDSDVPITVNVTGLLDLNGHSDSLGALTLVDGRIDTGSGTLTLMEDVTLGNSGCIFCASYVGGKLVLQTDRTFTSKNPCELDLWADISGAGGMIFTMISGGIDVYLAGDNTFGGTLTINNGAYVACNTPTALGSTAGGTILNGGRLKLNDTSVLDEQLTVNAASALILDSFLGTPSCWSGLIVLNTPLEVTAYWLADLSGPIIGPSSLRIEGWPDNSVCTLSGADANTYAGGTTVGDVTLYLNKSVANGAIPGDLTIYNDWIPEWPDAVVLLADNQIVDGALVTVDGHGANESNIYLNLNGHSDTIGGLTLIGATAQTGAGTLTVAGDVEATSTADSASFIYGKLALPGGGHTFTVSDGPATPDLRVAATVSGGGAGLTKRGAGQLELFANNTYSGGTYLYEGQVAAATPDAFGATGVGTFVYSNASVLVWNGTHIGAEPLTLSGTGSVSYAALDARSGSNSWAGPVTLAADTTFNVATNDYLNLAGALDGGKGFNKTGPGTLILSGGTDNTHSGSNVVSLGTLALAKSGTARAFTAGQLVIGRDSATAEDLSRDTFVLYAGSSASQIASGVPVAVNNTGQLDLNGRSDSLGPLTLVDGCVDSDEGTLTLTGDVTLSKSGSPSSVSLMDGKLSLPADRTFTTASECRLYIYSEVSGTGGMVFTQADDMNTFLVVLDGHNTFQGVLTVNSNVDVRPDTSSALGDAAGGTILNGGELSLYSQSIENEQLTVNAPSTLELYGYPSTSRWNGLIVLNEPLAVSASDEAELSGPIIGPGALNIYGWNTGANCTLSGADANTYAGGTTVSDVTLRLNKSVANGAIPGDLTICDDRLQAQPDIVVLLADNQIADGARVTVDGRGSDAGMTRLHLNEHSDAIGGLTLFGGTVQSGNGTLTLAGDLDATSTTEEPAAFYCNLSLPAGNHTFDIADGPYVHELFDGPVAYDFSIGTIVGSGGYTKTGGGTIHIIGSSTYTGPTTIAGGAALVESDTPFGAASAGTVVNSNASVVVWFMTPVGNEPLTLYGTGCVTYAALEARIGDNSWAGPITLGSDALIRVATNSTLALSGVISGAGGFDKDGPGTLSFTGDKANSFSGAALVRVGELVLGRTATSTVPHDLVVGSNDAGAPSANVSYTASDQVVGNITVNRSGYLDLNSHSDGIADLMLNGGADVQGTGTLTIAGNILTDPLGITNAYSQIDSKLGFEGLGTREIAVRATPSSSGVWTTELILAGSVSGASPLLKTGDGDLRLSAASSFTGPLTATEGCLSVLHDLALGATNSGVTLSGSAKLTLGDPYVPSDVNIGAEPLVLDSQPDALASAVVAYSDCSWAGSITLLRDVEIWCADIVILELSGPIGGVGGLKKTYRGQLRLTGNQPNTYAGETVLDYGTMILDKDANTTAIPGNFTIGQYAGAPSAVRCDHPGLIADSAQVKIASTGAWLLNGQTETVGPVIGDGEIDLGAGGSLHTSFNGLTTNFAGRIEGSGTVFKEGSGTWTLSGVNTFAGLTKVFGGTLNVNGVQPASGVEVGPAGRLGGTGTVGALSGPGGTVAPGLSIGTLTASNVTFSAGGTFAAELGATGCDRLAARGDVALGGAALALAAPGLLPSEGQTFLILDNDGADTVSGTFAGLAEGATATDGLRQYAITYAGGDGNDVVLSATNTAALRPALAFAAAAGELALSWPQNDITWELHSATNLVAPVAWTALPQPYPTNETGSVILEPGPEKQKFFRLYHP